MPCGAHVPMAPLIDMVFLLLVFFMTASAMSQAGNKLELDLPESASAQVADDFSGRVVVSIDNEGSFFMGTSPVGRESLRRMLAEMRASDPSVKLSIRADQSTPFAAVKEVMAAAADSGIQDYLYATYQAGAR